MKKVDLPGIIPNKLFLFVLFMIVLFSCKQKASIDSTNVNWEEYNGDGCRNHYSTLSQVTPRNILKLKRVWEYHSGGADTMRNRSQIQCNPLIIDGILYGVSAASQPFALDAATGKEIWKASLADVNTT